MTVEHVEVVVEEPSMEAALRILLPKLIGDGMTFQVYPSNGKQDLLENLPKRFRGYQAWFFGDMDAVRAVFPRVPDTIERKASFRDPDAIRGGTWEAFERILQRAGYFTGGFRKLEAAREIAAQMDPHRNRSHSFAVFRDTMRTISGV